MDCMVRWRTVNFCLYHYGVFWLYCYSGVSLEVSSYDCPSPIQRIAFRCFSGYNTQLLNMLKSQATLFSGVDVEVLRAFCSSYNEAMECIQKLKSVCPESEHKSIEMTQMNLKGAKPELSALCTDDSIYEQYARHMSCYRMYGSLSEKCFEDTMNTSIRLMKWIDDSDLDKLCRNLKRTLRCINAVIEENCGREAASLVHVLVKPMVRRSTSCDVRKRTTVIQVDAKTHFETSSTPLYISNSKVIHVLDKNQSNLVHSYWILIFSYSLIKCIL